MRTLAQIKRDKGIQMEANPDSLYTQIERKPKVFSDLQIPRNLQVNSMKFDPPWLILTELFFPNFPARPALQV